ncbi:MAG: methyltransferase domain-containing protein [Microthrixaceae bacterium]
MSSFSAVDAAVEPLRLIELLDESAVGLAAMKHYMAVTHSLRQASAPVLDLGCGAGHDLTVLASLGVACVGVDPSSVMVDAASTRCGSPLARACGERLRFADGSFAGCWIERVLMHVADPAAVIMEVVRCVQPRGLLTIFEPDWSSLAVNGSPVPTEWVRIARHPAIGSLVGGLLAAADCLILDRVEERSWWTFEDFDRITNLQQSLDRAVVAGKASAGEVQEWLSEQHRRAADDDFRAEITKILWVATTPA